MGQVIYKERKNTNSTKWDDCLEKFGREDLSASVGGRHGF